MPLATANTPKKNRVAPQVSNTKKNTKTQSQQKKRGVDRTHHLISEVEPETLLHFGEGGDGVGREL